MTGKTSNLWFGLVLILLGILTIRSKSFYSAQYMQTIDWGSGHKLIGSLMVGLGICLLVMTLRKR